MDEILTKLEAKENWKQLMRASCRRNSLNTSHAGDLTILKLKMLNDRFKNSYETLKDKISKTWIENQLRAYHWILIALSQLEDTPILEFKPQHWHLLQSIFQYKTPIFLKFQARKLVAGKSKKNKNWTQQQNEMLKEIVMQHADGKMQWNEIARELYENSNQQIFRTGKHCRERWLNHLDPSKERGSWTADDDLFLLKKVEEQGKKWSQFAAFLKRTEHMVKNRFNSILIKQRKLTPNIKKEDKLIAQARKRIELNDNDEEELSWEEEGVQAQVEKPMEKSKVQIEEKREEKVVEEPEVEERKSRILKKSSGEHQSVEAFTGLDGIQSYVRQNLDFRSSGTAEFAPIYSPYSPYWSYSPNNGTSSNFMNSSPSPLSYYLGYNGYSFANCFSRFTNQLNSIATAPSAVNDKEDAAGST